MLCAYALQYIYIYHIVPAGRALGRVGILHVPCNYALVIVGIYLPVLLLRAYVAKRNSTVIAARNAITQRSRG